MRAKEIWAYEACDEDHFSTTPPADVRCENITRYIRADLYDGLLKRNELAKRILAMGHTVREREAWEALKEG